VLFLYSDDAIVVGGRQVAPAHGPGIAILGLLWLARLGLGRAATSQRSEVVT
jgi:hypothetical protein